MGEVEEVRMGSRWKRRKKAGERRGGEEGGGGGEGGGGSRAKKQNPFSRLFILTASVSPFLFFSDLLPLKERRGNKSGVFDVCI